MDINKLLQYLNMLPRQLSNRIAIEAKNNLDKLYSVTRLYNQQGQEIWQET